MDNYDVLVESGNRHHLGSIELQNLLDRSVQHTLNFCGSFEEVVINTRHGVPICTYYPTDNVASKPAIVTFHDIGTNHNSFLGFFSYPEMSVILQHFSVYHICAPGHECGKIQSIDHGERSIPLKSESSAMNSSIFTISGRAGSLDLSGRTYPSMDELADMIEDVLDHFQLKYIFGIGMGAGANVFARYAMKPNSSLSGIFLINPDASTCSYYPWFRLKWTDLPQLRRNIYSDYLRDFMDSHWFGSCYDGGNIYVNEMYSSFFHKLNPQSAAGYIQSFIDRTDLNLRRELQPSLKDSVAHLRTDVCLVCAENARDKVRSLVAMNGRMDPQKTQYLTIPDCSGLLLEEHMDKLSINLLYFMRSIGLVLSLTPEKLQDGVQHLRQERLKLQNLQLFDQISNEILRETGDEDTVYC